MATLYENYPTSDVGLFFTNTAIKWPGQVFTPSISHTITSVKLQMYRTGNPGTLTINIYAVDGTGVPAGAIKASGTTNGDTLTANAAGEWREIVLTPGPDNAVLTASSKYAIVLVDPSGDDSNKAWVNGDYTGNYAGGYAIVTVDGGINWNQYHTGNVYDLGFEDWGDPYSPPSSGGGGLKMKCL